jgi:hypothetical protein
MLHEQFGIGGACHDSNLGDLSEKVDNLTEFHRVTVKQYVKHHLASIGLHYFLKNVKHLLIFSVKICNNAYEITVQSEAG